VEIRIFQKGFNYSQDGPGNRLVYHLQGCNLRCPWCSNPEGLNFSGGKALDIRDVAQQICSSRMMFFDGGGVTFTGGEVTLQFEALKELLTLLKQENIHTCIETNGCHIRLPELFPLVDHLIMDCKHHDPKIHQAVTGVSCALTHQNLRLAIEAGKQPAVRIPLIGGFNAAPEDALRFAALFRDLGLPGNGTLELLPYHEYGKDKYKALSMDYTMTEAARISPSTVSEFTRIFTDAGIHVIRT
jgi:pyruvate formate lyase activating enzyme